MITIYALIEAAKGCVRLLEISNWGHTAMLLETTIEAAEKLRGASCAST